jgi:hypothetical protein
MGKDSLVDAAPVATAKASRCSGGGMSRKANKRKRKARQGRHVPAEKARNASVGFAAGVAGIFRSLLALFGGGTRKGVRRREAAVEAETVDGAAIAASAAAAANMAALTMDATAIAADAASRATHAAAAGKPPGPREK